MFFWNVPPKINVPPVTLKSFLKNVPPEIIVPPVKPWIFVLNVPFLWQFLVAKENSFTFKQFGLVVEWILRGLHYIFLLWNWIDILSTKTYPLK